MKLETFLPIQRELTKAREKHPVFAENPEQGVMLIMEEALELVRAVNDNEPTDRIEEEACHIAVTAIRFIELLGKGSEDEHRQI